MLRWISMLGGLLIMMGHHGRSEALFYYFRLEDNIPENPLLRLIDKHVSLEFVRQQLKDSYSETGRPSIDPELLLRILLIGYLYGITSERKLVEELRMHLATNNAERPLMSPVFQCNLFQCNLDPLRLSIKVFVTPKGPHPPNLEPAHSPDRQSYIRWDLLEGESRHWQ
jgi:hypothetical protein